MILNLILPDAQRAQAVPQIVKVLLPATNADRSIAGAHRVARAEDAAAPVRCRELIGGGEVGVAAVVHKERWKREKFAKISVYL